MDTNFLKKYPIIFKSFDKTIIFYKWCQNLSLWSYVLPYGVIL